MGSEEVELIPKFEHTAVSHCIFGQKFFDNDQSSEPPKYEFFNVGPRKLKCRENPAYRERERIKNLERTRRMRENPEFRDRERIRNRLSKQRARQDPSYREAERLKNRLMMRAAREDPLYREAERVRNRNHKRRMREDPIYREQERLKYMERKRWKLDTPSQPDYEWMDIGNVTLDENSQMSFDQGLSRVAPPWQWPAQSHQYSDYENHDPQWLTHSNPDIFKYFQHLNPPTYMQEDTDGRPFHHMISDEVQLSISNPTSLNSLCHVSVKQEHLESNNLSESGESSSLKEDSEISPFNPLDNDFDLRESETCQQLKDVQTSSAHQESVVDSNLLHDNRENYCFQTHSDSFEQPEGTDIESHKRFNFSLPANIKEKLRLVNEVDIFPLFLRTEPTCPRLDWQIEVVPIYKKRVSCSEKQYC